MKTLPLAVSVQVLAVLLSGAALAQQYRWTDKDGKVRYGDTPPSGVKATRLKEPPPAAQPSPKASAPRPATDVAASSKGDPEAAKKDRLAKKAACSDANNRLAALQGGKVRAPGGSRLTADEYDVQYAKVQQALNASCD